MVPRDDDSQAALAAAIRQLRGEMTQEELGHRAAIHASWLSHIESGRVDPRWSSIQAIARGLGVPAAHLIELAEELQTQKSPPTE